ncbi:hypothetical protein BU23DRAFT_554157 [Bimuria novae-zelandiae CBS 107.79]|uniref:Uncharacterized protein n=1 Tax=Bimuria novae-zelandiae CBS 107.79 TaxID=1447943 RepID=A0A6A5VC06_9PLEO|nr:hypothetical protein BU23DRAFT_554157 [Bimuria novae-zelandiae CBS 107.79]
MALAAQAPVRRATYDGSRPRFQSLEAWLNVYGNAEYAIYKRDAAPNPMSYEAWSKSEHVLGPFLWYTTLDVWEEDSSTDEESEVEALKSTTRAPLKQPKKSAITNGHGKRGPKKSAPSVAHIKSEDADATAKRKRKPKKPYLSEDIVVSDVSDEIDEPAPITEAPPSPVTGPASPMNGRRKSGGRKKKQYLSAEIISPEDEEDDPMAMNGVAATADPVHESSVPEHNISVASAPPEPTKGKRGRKPKKKSLSQALISRDDEDDHVDAAADAATTPKNAPASPEGPGTSSSRRGLRTRTLAQQRPYFHNAQVFEELVSDDPIAESDTQPSPPKAKPKLKLTNLAQVSYPEETEEERQDQEEEKEVEAIVPVNDEDDDELMIDVDEPQHSRKAHYKGKGRAWKKTSDDEDEDYKSPVKLKPNQPKRKLGRRKSTQTTDGPAEVLETEELTEPQQQGEQEKVTVRPATQSSAQKANKKQRKPRRSNHLSEEFVRSDDSDTAAEDVEQPKTKTEAVEKQAAVSASPMQKTPRKGRGRPRKSDQGSTPKDHTPKDPVNFAIGGDVTPASKKSPSVKRMSQKSTVLVSLSDLEEDEKATEIEAAPEQTADEVAQPESIEPSKSLSPLANLV